jgi:beta-glucosidase
MVLLVNRDGALPLRPETRLIAVIGATADDPLYMVGGSGGVALTPGRAVSPLAGLRARAGDDVEVRSPKARAATSRLPTVPVPDLAAEYWHGEPAGAPAVTATESGIDVPGTPEKLGNPWSARWTGSLLPAATGPYRFSLTFGGEAELYLDGVRVAGGLREAACFISGPELPVQAVVDLEAGRPVELRVEYRTGPALDIAKR